MSETKLEKGDKVIYRLFAYHSPALGEIHERHEHAWVVRNSEDGRLYKCADGTSAIRPASAEDIEYDRLKKVRQVSGHTKATTMFTSPALLSAPVSFTRHYQPKPELPDSMAEVINKEVRDERFKQDKT